jgi:dolichol-phosphate mannosyltransferase
METSRSLPTSPSETVQLSLVIPCYNEGLVLPQLERRLKGFLEPLGLRWEVVFVDDGSRDDTYAQLSGMHRAEPRFKVARFSRNFGHQAAVSAGVAFASGDMVAILDADLQDPPEILAQCITKLREGYDVVYAVRRKRKENLLKRAAYAAFYRILSYVAEVDIPLDSGDFCLMSRRVAETLRQMPERNVFLRGLRAWVGFKQIGIEYERAARAAGDTKYPLKKLIRLATDGVFAFSTLPLRLATYLGFAALGFSMVAGLFVIAWRLFGFRFMGYSASQLPGWATVVVAMFFLNGIQFLILGCMGEYIGRIYTEAKQRPRWIVGDTLGLASGCAGKETLK